MENPEKNTWGGKRREGKTQTAKGFRIENDLLPMLNKQHNINRFVNEAIREKFAREGETK